LLPDEESPHCLVSHPRGGGGQQTLLPRQCG
jgi:hypothetical protein